MYKKQPLAGSRNKSGSKKSRQVHKKTLELESLFNRISGLYPATLLKKILRYRCFSCEFFEIFWSSFFFHIIFGRLLLNWNQGRYSSFAFIANKIKFSRLIWSKKIVNDSIISKAEISPFLSLFSRNILVFCDCLLLFTSFDSAEIPGQCVNLFKVNSNDTRTTSLRLFWCLYFLTLSRGRTFLWHFHC